MARWSIFGSLILLSLLAPSCKEDDDCNCCHDGCDEGRRAIYIGAVIVDGNRVQIVTGIPEGHYGLVYLDPQGGAIAVMAMSGSMDIGEFEPGNYEVRLILYSTGGYHCPCCDHHICDYSGEIYGTSFVVPEVE